MWGNCLFLTCVPNSLCFIIFLARLVEKVLYHEDFQIGWTRKLKSKSWLNWRSEWGMLFRNWKRTWNISIHLKDPFAFRTTFNFPNGISPSHVFKPEEILRPRSTEVVSAILCVHALAIEVLLKDPPPRSIRAHTCYTCNPVTLAVEQRHVISEQGRCGCWTNLTGLFAFWML
jgi:hypothetical protein